VRRIFIGDVQGCREPLVHLLAACGHRAGDVLHPVGDLVNKGPDSLGVLRLLRDLDARPVLGNHDLEWLERGGAGEPELRGWLAAQPVVRVFDDVILVHAGLHPRWRESDLRALDAAGIEYATNVRYCDRDGRRPPSDWPPPPPPFEPWDTFYAGAKRVVFGHWARRGLVRTPKVVGLDSGCVYGGQLSAWIAEEDRIVQVAGWTGGANGTR
jgi:hypothetical protein